jgi:multimeric flavodoxin WrbA
MNKVLALGGSIRAKFSNRELILGMASRAADSIGYQELVRKQLLSTSLCNSEILAGAALAGARMCGAEIDYIPLCHLFPRKDRGLSDLQGDDDVISHLDTLDIDEEALGELLDSLGKSQGVVLATPVYFGDRSSVANKFLQLAAVRERVRDKTFGVVSVGAKRNGGQETCNIFSMYEMLHQGTFGVGNGMPTSQYGGTAVGGDLGMVTDDDWGLATAFGTGERVAQVSRIVAAGLEVAAKPKANIVFLLAMDTRDGKLKAHIDSLIAEARETTDGIEFKAINLVEHDIYRCLGCKVCPKDGDTRCEHPQCIIRDPDDYLETARTLLAGADGIIVCGINPSDIADLVTRYQVFTERMRSIRRNNYELSNTLFAGLCYHDFGATINPIHSLKVMVSYIRHNTVAHKPIELFEHNGALMDSGAAGVAEFCRAARIVAAGKAQVVLPEPVYNAYGEGGGYAGDVEDNQ